LPLGLFPAGRPATPEKAQKVATIGERKAAGKGGLWLVASEMLAGQLASLTHELSADLLARGEGTLWSLERGPPPFGSGGVAGFGTSVVG